MSELLKNIKGGWPILVGIIGCTWYLGTILTEIKVNMEGLRKDIEYHLGDPSIHHGGLNRVHERIHKLEDRIDN